MSMVLVSKTPVASVARCGVCGFAEVQTDEVVDREVIFLAECPRCEHRWTSTAPIGARAARRAQPEVASAA